MLVTLRLEHTPNSSAYPNLVPTLSQYMTATVMGYAVQQGLGATRSNITVSL